MPRLKTLAVCSATGGAGKTFVATNLAYGILQQVRGGVLLVDGSHPCPGDAAARMGLPRARGITDMLPIIDRVTPEFLGSYLSSAPCGVPVLNLATDIVQAGAVTRPVLDRIFRILDHTFDYLVIDLGTVSGEVGNYLIDRSDQVCVLVDPTPTGIVRTGHLLALLRAAQLPASATALCLNRVTDRMPANIADGLGVPVLAHLPDQPEYVDAATQRQRVLLEMRPDVDLSAVLGDLARAFVQRSFRQRASASGEPASAADDTRRHRP